MRFSENAMHVLKERYLLKDDKRRTIETPQELFRRVASAVARAEDSFAPEKSAEYEEKFYRIMADLEFLPNSPTLMNAGTQMGQLSACFVIPVEDSIEGIFGALTEMAVIHRTGGGTGFSFSNLRPRDDVVASTMGAASGPLSFMKIFDTATGVIIQGGRRRGANMGILRYTHPDIVDFIEAKLKGEFQNFNLSVSVSDEFMDCAVQNARYPLINPRTKKIVRTVNAGDIFKKIIKTAWQTGDPGLIFEDEINRKNPTPALGRIEATNPCGELPLLRYESCNLGSINLSKMVINGNVDWEKLAGTVSLGVRFLDDVIEINRYPLPKIKEVTRANRKIGLGVMGFADMLILLNIPYNSKEAVVFAGRLMKFIKAESLKASRALAARRGEFPNFNNSIYSKSGIKLRNATVNTIAPTGTISIIAGCSSGIEPLFAVSFVRNVMEGKKLVENNIMFQETARKRRFYSPRLLSDMARGASIQKIKNIPADVQRIFVTALDIEPRWHVAVQAAFQEWTDNSVSKTVNLPEEASVEDVKKIYLTAHREKCKGITVYRYGSRENQALSVNERRSGKMVSADPEYSGGCPEKLCVF